MHHQVWDGSLPWSGCVSWWCIEVYCTCRWIQTDQNATGEAQLWLGSWCGFFACRRVVTLYTLHACFAHRVWCREGWLGYNTIDPIFNAG